MALPSNPYTQIALLLELERARGAASRRETIDRMAEDFPDMTGSDKYITSPDGKKNKWDHLVDTARQDLKDLGQLQSVQKGLWQITDAGRRALRQKLRELGATDVDGLIRSSRTLPDALGHRWQPEGWTERSQGKPDPPDQSKPSPKPHKPVVAATSFESVQSAPVEVTPVALEDTRSSEQPNISTRLLDRVLALGPTQFEHLVAQLLRA